MSWMWHDAGVYCFSSGEIRCCVELSPVLLFIRWVGCSNGILPNMVKAHLDPSFAHNSKFGCYWWDYSLLIYLGNKIKNSLSPEF